MIVCIDLIFDAIIAYLIWIGKDMINITMQSFIHGNYIIFTLASTSCVVEV